MKIAVIGSGSWGSALSLVLAGNGCGVSLWSYLPEESAALARDGENKAFLPGAAFPENVSFTSDLAAAAEGADVFLFATPSAFTGATAEALAPFAPDGALIVSASKGLDQTTLGRLTETIQQKIPQCKTAALSGPSHAEEVAKRMPTACVIASEDRGVSNYLADVFMNDYFRVYTCDDVIGVEMGGALKNVIALGVGIADGLGLGDNTKAALMTRGMHEIARLGVKMGGDAATFSGLSGMGDLIVTCTSVHSRNRRAGVLIGRGMSAEDAMAEVKMVVEGVYAAKAAKRLAEKVGVETPITEQACGVLFEGRDARETVLTLMTRDRKHEQLVDKFMGDRDV
jgi:glycerol-3-phosphate dehydrogenase (NAD(P)+)